MSSATAGRAAAATGKTSESAMTREDMVAAIAAQPAPVVRISDINDGQEAVRVRDANNTY